MAKLEPVHYTLVAHSGLDNAVMLRSVNTEDELRALIRMGAWIADDYRKAEQAEHDYNFTPRNTSITPNATERGSFSTKTHDGCRVYIPNGE